MRLLAAVISSPFRLRALAQTFENPPRVLGILRSDAKLKGVPRLRRMGNCIADSALQEENI